MVVSRFVFVELRKVYQRGQGDNMAEGECVMRKVLKVVGGGDCNETYRFEGFSVTIGDGGVV